jgi:hypothetical protein
MVHGRFSERWGKRAKMFGWLHRSPYRNMRVEDLACRLARARAETAATFRGLSARSQLNEMADRLVRDYWGWCRATKDPLGSTLTLGALAIAVEEEAVACSAEMTGANLADIFKVNTAIWHLLAQRGLVDAFNADHEMPQRLMDRINAIIKTNMKEASELNDQPGARVIGVIGNSAPGHAEPLNTEGPERTIIELSKPA